MRRIGNDERRSGCPHESADLRPIVGQPDNRWCEACNTVITNPVWRTPAQSKPRPNRKYNANPGDDS